MLLAIHSTAIFLSHMCMYITKAIAPTAQTCSEALLTSWFILIVSQHGICCEQIHSIEYAVIKLTAWNMLWGNRLQKNKVTTSMRTMRLFVKLRWRKRGQHKRGQLMCMAVGVYLCVCAPNAWHCWFPLALMFKYGPGIWQSTHTHYKHTGFVVCWYCSTGIHLLLAISSRLHTMEDQIISPSPSPSFLSIGELGFNHVPIQLCIKAHFLPCAKFVERLKPSWRSTSCLFTTTWISYQLENPGNCLSRVYTAV